MVLICPTQVCRWAPLISSSAPRGRCYWLRCANKENEGQPEAFAFSLVPSTAHLATDKVENHVVHP